MKISHGKRHPRVVRRPGSKMYRIEQHLIPLTRVMRGTPSTFALHLSSILGFVVDRQDVWKVLNSRNFTKKVASIVPGLADPNERAMFIRQLRVIWFRAEQMIFVDEKKFKNGELMKKVGQYGYALVGQRLPKSTVAAFLALAPVMHHTVEVVAATAYMPYNPRVLRDGRTGDVGHVSFALQNKKLDFPNIIRWIRYALCPILTPYPGPRSIVLFDNRPEHRSHQLFIEYLINRRGAYCLWNPPQSPDLNPQEKMWDVTQSSAKRRMHELAAGMHGAQRPFGLGDLIFCLQEARLSLRAFYKLLNDDPNA